MTELLTYYLVDSSILECLPFRKKIPKILDESQMEEWFSGNLFRNYGKWRGSLLFLVGMEWQKIPCQLLSLQVFSLSSAKNNYRKLNCKIVWCPHAILFCWFADFGKKRLPLFHGHPNRFILTNGKQPLNFTRILPTLNRNTGTLSHVLIKKKLDKLWWYGPLGLIWVYISFS